MLSTFVSLGDKIELRSAARAENEIGEDSRKTYGSMVHDILSEDRMEIVMPTEKTKLILLPIDSEYSVVFYTEHGLYQCMVRIADRYKTNNMYILVVDLISNLRKYQRRDFYRFSCTLQICARNLEEEELQAIENKQPYELHTGLPMMQGVIVDISGGGLRFVSKHKFEAKTLLCCEFDLVTGSMVKKYELIGKLLSVRTVENRKNMYEHRVQFYNIRESIREEIIKYIFEEERKNRKKENYK